MDRLKVRSDVIEFDIMFDVKEVIENLCQFHLKSKALNVIKLFKTFARRRLACRAQRGPLGVLVIFWSQRDTIKR